MIATIFGLGAAALVHWRPILAALGGAGAMFLVWTVVDIADDAIVARRAAQAAREGYVRQAELAAIEAERAQLARLLKLENERAEQLAAERAQRQAALETARMEIAAKVAANEDLQDEIDELVRRRPAGVPSVRDLGVELRN